MGCIIFNGEFLSKRLRLFWDFEMPKAIVSFAGPLQRFFSSVVFLFCFIMSILSIGSTARIRTASPIPFLFVVILKQ